MNKCFKGYFIVHFPMSGVIWKLVSFRFAIRSKFLTETISGLQTLSSTTKCRRTNLQCHLCQKVRKSPHYLFRTQPKRNRELIQGFLAFHLSNNLRDLFKASGEPGTTWNTIYVMFLFNSYSSQMCETFGKCGKLNTEGYII